MDLSWRSYQNDRTLKLTDHGSELFALQAFDPVSYNLSQLQENSFTLSDWFKTIFARRRVGCIFLLNSIPPSVQIVGKEGAGESCSLLSFSLSLSSAFFLSAVGFVPSPTSGMRGLTYMKMRGEVYLLHYSRYLPIR